MLIASSAEKAVEFFMELLSGHQFSPVRSVSTAGEARRTLVDTPFDILIVNAPLSDEFGARLALDVAEKGDTGVLTISKPVSKQIAYQSIKLLAATRIRMKTLTERAASLQEKMDDIRVINRAKWILIDKLKMSEPEAHRYIEKRAMDTCRKKREIAESIIRASQGDTSVTSITGPE